MTCPHHGPSIDHGIFQHPSAIILTPTVALTLPLPAPHLYAAHHDGHQPTWWSNTASVTSLCMLISDCDDCLVDCVPGRLATPCSHARWCCMPVNPLVVLVLTCEVPLLLVLLVCTIWSGMTCLASSHSFLMLESLILGLLLLFYMLLIMVIINLQVDVPLPASHLYACWSLFVMIVL